MKKSQFPKMAERIKRCKYCGREMRVAALEHLENPFCKECLGERYSLAAAAIGEVELITMGDVVKFKPIQRTLQ